MATPDSCGRALNAQCETNIERQRANAKLMAKSPDLLDGCEIALEALEFIVGFDDLDDLIVDIAAKAINKIKAKLEGE